MFAIDEEVLGGGRQSAERDTGAVLEAEGGRSLNMIMSMIGPEYFAQREGRNDTRYAK